MKHPHRWDLPKGHADAGESETQCALRELAEETGITAGDIELDPAFRFTTSYQVRDKRHGRRTAQKSLVVFLAELIREVNIQVTEHAGFVWRLWDPPHAIQAATIDPLLAAVEKHFVK